MNDNIIRFLSKMNEEGCVNNRTMPNSYNIDILSVGFLAFIAIVIAAIVYSYAPGYLIMPTYIVIAVITWIAYSHITTERYKKYKQRAQYLNMMKNMRNAKRELTLQEEIDMMNDDTSTPEENGQMNHIDKSNEPPKPPAPVKQDDPRAFDIAMYNNAFDIRDYHTTMGCSGDNQIANRMKYMGMQPQLATDIRATYGKYSLQPYLEEELRDTADRVWWDNDQLELSF